MASNEDTADAILDILVRCFGEEQRAFLSYKQLARLLGRPGLQRLLQPALDLARAKCADRGLPELTVLVVSEASIVDGTLLPSAGAIAKYGGILETRRLQALVLTHAWRS